jgi:hypothetical protein
MRVLAPEMQMRLSVTAGLTRLSHDHNPRSTFEAEQLVVQYFTSPIVRSAIWIFPNVLARSAWIHRFIEAHHLKAISSLKEGVAVHYDTKDDVAALCSNCHRMIHRSGDPSNFKAFQETLSINET